MPLNGKPDVLRYNQRLADETAARHCHASPLHIHAHKYARMPPMPFVKRNLEQQIVGLSISQDNVAETVEFVPADSAEIQNFLAEHFLPVQSQALVAEDIALVRVLEDVVDLLITRNFITFSDLPIPAQNKLLAKKGMRERLIASTNNLLVTEKPLL